jgi:hypothetical protein
MAVSGWRNLLFLVFAVVIMFGYIGQGAAMVFVMLPAIFAIGREPPVFSTMLISGGRRQRFATTLRLVVTDAVLLCLVALVVSGLSILFARFMPTFSIEGKELSFSSIDPHITVVPLILVPFVSAIQLFSRGRLLVLVGAMMVGIFAVVFLTFGRPDQVELMLSPLNVVGLLVAVWSIFLLVLSRICFEWCLVGRH